MPYAQNTWRFDLDTVGAIHLVPAADCWPDAIPDGCQLAGNDRNFDEIPDNCQWGACCCPTAGVCYNEVLPEECTHDRFHREDCAVRDVSCEKIVIPTLSEWGMLALALLMPIGIAIRFGRHRYRVRPVRRHDRHLCRRRRHHGRH